MPSRPALALIVAGTALVLFLVWSGLSPYDRPTWALEVAPVVIALAIMVPTRLRFPLTSLLYFWIFVHAVVLIVGGTYTYARVLVSDRIRQEDNSYTDGPTVAYDVAVSGNQAVNLVEVAEQSGNVRVTFSGRYRVTEYKGEQGTRLQHEVRADEVAVSLRGQSVRVVGKPVADHSRTCYTPTQPMRARGSSASSSSRRVAKRSRCSCRSSS